MKQFKLFMPQSRAETLPPIPAERLDNHRLAKQALLQQLSQSPLSFAAFMEQALYHPQYGYYQAPFCKIGEQGDYITAAQSSPLFAQSLARQCAEIFEKLGVSQIMELGPGTGFMACHLLQALDQMNCCPSHYYLCETSTFHRKVQAQQTATLAPHLQQRFQWLEWPPSQPFRGIVLANEVLDALPVERIIIDNHRYYQCLVQNQNQALAWDFQPISDPWLEPLLHHHWAQYPQPYLTELHRSLPSWLRLLQQTLQQTVLLFIDYGYLAHEFFHPQRSLGTLTCFFRHHSHSDPLLHVGIQDITASINFSWFAQIATQLGFELIGLTSQANFLLNNGLLALLEKLPEEKRWLQNPLIKQWLMPEHMGERCKVIALGHQCQLSLQGFAKTDQRHQL